MIADVWRSMRPGPRALVAVAGLVIGLNLVVQAVTLVTGGSGPGGPTSSSYATAGDGLAGLAGLLARQGHPVQQLRVSLDRAGLDPSSTLVLADPAGVSPQEGRALAQFVAAGGHLVAAGSTATPVLNGVFRLGLEWDGTGVVKAGPLLPVPEVAGVAAVESAAGGTWGAAGTTLPVVAGDRGVLVTVASVGAGRVVALADASPLQNRLLARADNAAFALAAVGHAGRPVAFAEEQHGYGRTTGLGAVPSRWRWAAAGGVLAALVWMWARGRRLGPPDDAERVQPPPRRAFVEAMAAALARTRQPEVIVADLQERARRRVAALAGLPPGAPDDDVRRVAVEAGLNADEVEAVFRPARRGSEEDAVAVGRILARLGERSR